MTMRGWEGNGIRNEIKLMVSLMPSEINEKEFKQTPTNLAL